VQKFHGNSQEKEVNIRHIGLIGYGEVGKVFCSGLKAQPGVESCSAWDLKFADAATQHAERGHAATAGVTAQPSMQALCAASDLVISAVTASNTLAVAEEAARFVRPGSLFLDLNSASPGTKQKAAALIDAAGAQYVEAGVMTSVPPYGIKVPMLLGGARAEELAAQLVAWGMDAKAVSQRLGVASALWYLDSPVSNSGRLKAAIQSRAAERGWNWQVELVMNPDAILVKGEGIAATADSAILDGPVRWFGLAEYVVRRDVPGAWVVDLTD